MTHTGYSFGSRIAERLTIGEDQIQRAKCWNTDFMHKEYLTTMLCKFIRGMVGFNSNYFVTYCIVSAFFHFLDELFNFFWIFLHGLVNFSFSNISTAQFVKLFLYLCIVFLQDAVIFYSRFLTYSWFQHDLFNMRAFRVFSAQILA